MFPFVGLVPYVQMLWYTSSAENEVPNWKKALHCNNVGHTHSETANIDICTYVRVPGVQPHSYVTYAEQSGTTWVLLKHLLDLCTCFF